MLLGRSQLGWTLGRLLALAFSDTLYVYVFDIVAVRCLHSGNYAGGRKNRNPQKERETLDPH